MPPAAGPSPAPLPLESAVPRDIAAPSGACALVQPPGAVQPPAMAVYMGAAPPYVPAEAEAQHARLRAALDAAGLPPVAMSTVLERAAAVPGPGRDRVMAAAGAAVSAPLPDRAAAARDALAGLTPAELVSVLLHRPGLELEADPDLARISPDTAYERYVLAPLFGLMFPRDHFVVTGRGPVLGRLVRRDRRREAAVVALVLSLIGRAPVAVCPDGAVLEGGDYLEVGDAALIGEGVRTDAAATRFLIESGAIDRDRVAILRDRVRDPAAFHLDHRVAAAGTRTVVAAADRLDDAARLCVDLLARAPGGGYRVEARTLTLRQALDRLAVTVVPAPEDAVAGFAVNLLAVPGDRALVPESAPGGYLEALAAAGIGPVPVPFEAFHRQHGGLHCAVQILPPIAGAAPGA